MNNSIIWRSLDSIRFYLSARDKRTAIMMLVWLIVSSVMDIFGLASLVPIIMSASQPGSILKHKAARWLYDTLGFATEKKLPGFFDSGSFPVLPGKECVLNPD